MKRMFAILSTMLLLALTGCGGSSSSSNGVVNITLWHGYVGPEGKAMKAAAARFNATHPTIHISTQYYSNADYALQKVLTAIRGGSYPDIVYLYGSWAAKIAQSPVTVGDWNGSEPVMSSCKMTPRAHTSERGSTSAGVSTCSGDM